MQALLELDRYPLDDPADARERIVAVLSCYDRPGVVFSAPERLGFYGRVGPGVAP